MKHIRTFENFSFEEQEKFGRFGEEEDVELGGDFNDDDFDQNCEFCNCCPCDCEDTEDDEDLNELGEDEGDYGLSEEEEEEEEDQEENRIKRWADEEVLEKKKMNPGFKAYLDKQKAKNKDNKKEGKEDPKDKKDDKKKAKGLTAAQKKLPEAMQKAILKKQGK